MVETWAHTWQSWKLETSAQAEWLCNVIFKSEVFVGAHSIFALYEYSAMKHKVEQVAGPPQELIYCITHLHNLLKNLPSNLPAHPKNFSTTLALMQRM